MKTPKYMRIQGREISYKTGKPTGVFALNWRRIRDGIYSEQDKLIFQCEEDWFNENLPNPPYYGENNDNPQGAITYFKTENIDSMKEHIGILMDLLDKYNIPYDIVYTNYVGKIIYEDDFQVGVTD